MKKIFFLIIIGFILSGCSSLLYYPLKKQVYHPEQVKLKEESIYIESEDGNKIHAWWFASKKEQSLGTIVFFHGNAENMSTHFLNLSWIPNEGYNYIIFDYPGYWDSTGEPTPENTVLAGKAVINWVAKNKDQRPLIIYGQSLGGNIAMKTTLEVKEKYLIRNVIIDSSFHSYKRVARKVLSRSFITWLLQPLAYVVMNDKYAPGGDIKNISPIPMLFIHGKKDRVVEYEFSEIMYSIAQEPKEFWSIEEGQHCDSMWGHDKQYRAKLIEYLARTKTLL